MPCSQGLCLSETAGIRPNRWYEVGQPSIPTAIGEDTVTDPQMPLLCPGKAMGDITNPRWLYVKAGLFVVAGLLASGLLLIEAPNFKVAALLAVAIWCFARAYYFAFYVVEHYADPGYRFAGLWSFVRYAWQRRGLKPANMSDASGGDSTR